MITDTKTISEYIKDKGSCKGTGRGFYIKRGKVTEVRHIPSLIITLRLILSLFGQRV